MTDVERAQARILAEEMSSRQVQRQREQNRVEEVLAAEELRHMDTIARRREAEVRRCQCWRRVGDAFEAVAVTE